MAEEEDIFDTTSYDHLYKSKLNDQLVVLVGECGVGKTNFLQRYIDDTYTQTSATIGVEFAEKKVRLKNGMLVKLQLWDTCKPLTASRL